MPVKMNRLQPELQLFNFEKPLEPLYTKAKRLLEKKLTPAAEKRLSDLREQIETKTEAIYKNLGNWQQTQVARHPNRPYALDYIDRIFTGFTELHGDRNYGDDQSTVCGIAEFDGQSVVVVAQQKGRDTEENMKRNFGMPQPEGYRKALRFFEFAEKFNKPVITFIDTPGAYPGLEGEERSQGEAIARNLKVMSGLKVPVVAVVIGEGGSGGALGIGVANKVLMLENSVYSVISPESCASILWRDPGEKEKAAEALKNDAKTCLKFGVVDAVIKEALGGAHRDWDQTAQSIKVALKKQFKELRDLNARQLVEQRIERFSKLGAHEILEPGA